MIILPLKKKMITLSDSLSINSPLKVNFKVRFGCAAKEVELSAPAPLSCHA